ncbi:MAG: tetratricopeptide repeat protein [Tissierellales bacterium]|nr:tetratricopeptide repeat protein [Tissierellales bacterium]
MANKKTEDLKTIRAVLTSIVLIFGITVGAIGYIVCKDIDQPSNIQITITDTRPELNPHGEEQFIFTPQNFNDPNDVERMTLEIKKLVSRRWEQKSDGFTYRIQAVVAVTAIFFTLLVVVVSLFQYLKTKQFDDEFKQLKREIENLNDIKEKFEEQEKLTKKIVEFNVKTAKYAEANSYYHDALNDNENAVRYYDKAIEKADEIMKMEELDDCLRDFKKKSEKIEKQVEDLKFRAYNNRGSLKAEDGDREGAIRDYSEAIKINSDYVEPYYNRGILKRKMGNTAGAIKDYSEAIKINSEYVDAYYNRGILKAEDGDREGAIKDYSEAIKINSEYVKAYYNRGILKDKDGDRAGAMEDFSKAFELFRSQGNIELAENAKKAYNELKEETKK